jgi:hypothetical protein
MHGSRSKIPSKKISSGSVARRDLIPALKGSEGELRINTECDNMQVFVGVTRTGVT